MPCRDHYADDNAIYAARINEQDARIKTLVNRVAFAESSLCAALSALERTLKILSQESKRLLVDTDPLYHIDYTEAGVSKKELTEWWTQHQEIDNERKQAEKREQARRALIEKLTPEERELLGIK